MYYECSASRCILHVAGLHSHEWALSLSHDDDSHTTTEFTYIANPETGWAVQIYYLTMHQHVALSGEVKHGCRNSGPDPPLFEGDPLFPRGTTRSNYSKVAEPSNPQEAISNPSLELSPVRCSSKQKPTGRPNPHNQKSRDDRPTCRAELMLGGTRCH